MLRSFGKNGPQIDQIWASLSGGHRWAPVIRNPFNNLVTGPNFLVICYLEIKWQIKFIMFFIPNQITIFSKKWSASLRNLTLRLIWDIVKNVYLYWYLYIFVFNLYLHYIYVWCLSPFRLFILRLFIPSISNMFSNKNTKGEDRFSYQFVSAPFYPAFFTASIEIPVQSYRYWIFKYYYWILSYST